MKISGIANLGNTCYLNAALQCAIVACEPLENFFLSDAYLEQLGVASSESLAKAIAWLLEELRDPRNAVYPNLVKSRIDLLIPKFKGTDQHDCSEFLIQLLDHLHSEFCPPLSSSGSRSSSASSVAAMNGSISGRSFSAINWHRRGEDWWANHQKKENSIIRKIYQGAIRSVMTCSRCRGVSARFEAFTSLILSFPPDASSSFKLERLIKDLFQSEEIAGIECDYCRRKQTFTRTIHLWEVPPFLILTLSRFSFTARTARKLNNLVEYPVDTLLNLESLLAPEAPLQEFLDYKLYAVVEHEGTVNRGHYTAILKNQGSWTMANDARITHGIQPDRVCSNNAYMLFYRRNCTPDELVLFD